MKIMKPIGLLLLVISLLSPSAFAQSKADCVLKADLSSAGTPVSPHLYGAFFEDINYGADGGLYAELLQNCSFEFHGGSDNWELLGDGNGNETKIEIQTKNPINDKNLHYAQLKFEKPGLGIANDGFDGLVLTQDSHYRFSAYLRSEDSSITTLNIIIADDNDIVLAKQDITGITNQWKKFDLELIASGKTTEGKLKIITPKSGQVDLDMVSLFPVLTFKNRPNGLRSDLGNLLVDLKPKFFRFPGGCVVEGASVDKAYRWKDTIGNIEQRKSNDNVWGYNQSYGLGFYEYFLLCEDTGAEPLPVINCGMACQARNGNAVPVKDLGPWIQDALDLIEYANGDATSTWGAIRAKSGHPAPFNMKYLGIGNEQWGDGYYQRYKKFASAIKEKYPQIQLVFAAGPFASGGMFDDAWTQAKRTKADLVDEHYYMTPEWFLTNNKRYDKYDRNGPKVFVGEYAAQAEGRKNTLFAALSEAAFMTGLERNGDVVQLAAYAPLFAKDGSTQWTPDMIWFNNQKSYGTPDYYVQAMFSSNLSQKTIPSTLDIASNLQNNKGISGRIGLGSWATQVEYKNIKVVDATGKTLFEPKDINDLSGWKIDSGTWAVDGGVISQKGSADDCHIKVGDSNWSDYTLTLKARKKSGNEGMLILFGVKDKSYYWWNIGGWGNTQSAIEKGSGTTKGAMGNTVPLSVSSGKWYDIKIVLKGDVIKCYLDNRLIHEVKDPQGYDPVYSHVGKASNGDVIVKLVNVDSYKKDIQIQLSNSGKLKPIADVYVLSNTNRDAVNSFSKPTNVVPKHEDFNGVSSDFMYTVEPNSLTILRLHNE